MPAQAPPRGVAMGFTTAARSSGFRPLETGVQDRLRSIGGHRLRCSRLGQSGSSALGRRLSARHENKTSLHATIAHRGGDADGSHGLDARRPLRRTTLEVFYIATPAYSHEHRQDYVRRRRLVIDRFVLCTHLDARQAIARNREPLVTSGRASSRSICGRVFMVRVPGLGPESPRLHRPLDVRRRTNRFRATERLLSPSMDRLPKESFLALAAIGWADGSLQRIEKAGLLRAAQECGLEGADYPRGGGARREAPASARRRASFPALDALGAGTDLRARLMVRGARRRDLDDRTRDPGQSGGDKLGLDAPLRARAAAAATNDIAKSVCPVAEGPTRYDFVKLVDRLRERLEQITP